MSFLRNSIRPLMAQHIKTAQTAVPLVLGGGVVATGVYYLGSFLYNDKYVSGAPGSVIFLSFN